MFADRVKETTTTTGTGDLTLGGAATGGFQTFNSAFGTDFFFFYAITDTAAGAWEVGRGYLSSSTVLVREKVLASSNSNNAVNFAAGSKDVFNTVPSLYVEATALLMPYLPTRTPGIYGGY